MRYLTFILLLLGCYSITHAQSPQNNNASVSIMLNDAMEFIPSLNFAYQSTFNSAADYDGTSAAKNLGGPKTWTIKSTKSGYMQVQFQGLASSSSMIPISTISYSTTGVGIYTAATGSQQPAGSFNAGVQSYQLYLQFNPGWNYPAGTYAGNVTLTATQN